MEQQHAEKIRTYREKAREINEKCVIGDNRIKELQGRVSDGGLRTRDSRFDRPEQVVVCVTTVCNLWSRFHPMV